MDTVLDIYIGYDRNEIVAYHTLCQSILAKSSLPLRFTPINLGNLAHVFGRERHQLQSTEFSFSRFLVPYLSGYAGWSIFIDCDMLARADIAELFGCKDERYAVMVCKHDYTPRGEVKFRGNVQTRYEKKNWSSLMLFNNARCRMLTPDYVNSATGLELHQFKWLGDDDQIGGLPLEWNWLVAEYPYSERAKIAHFTLGGPYFADYKQCDYGGEWFAAYEQATSARER